MVKSFIKEESYPEIKAPRGIYSRTDRFKAYVGPLIAKIQKIIFSHPSFIKSVPVSDRPKYIEELFEGAVGDYYAGDYTAYESHFTKTYFEAIEFVAYDYIIGSNPIAIIILSVFKRAVSGKNFIIFRLVSLTVDATRMSGEMNTSLGNGLVNLIIINFICRELHGCSVIVIVEGDDSLFCTMAKITDADFLMCGLTCKLQKHDVITKASFCGLIFDPENKDIITDCIKVMLKTPYLPRKWVNVNNNVRLQILKCKALSIRWQYPGCPILVSYANMILRQTAHLGIRKTVIKHFKNEAMHSLQNLNFDEFLKIYSYDDVDKHCPTKPISISTRLLMESVFKLKVEEQLNLEEFFDDKNDLDPFFHSTIHAHTTQVQRDCFEQFIFYLPSDASSASVCRVNEIQYQNSHSKLLKLLLPLTRFSCRSDLTSVLH